MVAVKTACYKNVAPPHTHLFSTLTSQCWRKAKFKDVPDQPLKVGMLFNHHSTVLWMHIFAAIRHFRRVYMNHFRQREQTSHIITSWVELLRWQPLLLHPCGQLSFFFPPAAAVWLVSFDLVGAWGCVLCLITRKYFHRALFCACSTFLISDPLMNAFICVQLFRYP